jgi:TRAP-type C4-dicarboxylate transport system permease small subunit
MATVLRNKRNNSMLRTTLDRLYMLAAYMAAACMVLLAIMVMLGIVSRLAHFNVPGIDAYAGYLMAGSGFLALAHTFTRGEHIRVTLLIQKVPTRWARGLEVWSLFAASSLSGLFAAYSIRLAWQSHSFHDVSTGIDATPLWIPQTLMALGATVFFIAVFDAFISDLRGERAMTSNDLIKSE